ncbi:CIC11C00000000194 [Sungouiella intermedia]|uniref:CIC11C00000000194 n=1 Tax=Sungouiella intermedia TaxID=45354 RepID=A0A1L0BGA4_9ASCO|nr:CIC11C00000000194 [[Candida] intermedia]
MPPSDDPFVDQEKPAESSEFTLRPLRIQKRPDSSSSTATSTPQKPPNDEFVCRPMRLSLASSLQARRKSDSRDTRPNVKKSVSLSGSSELSTPISLPKAPSRVLSIKIKKLPLVQSPRRSSVADLSKWDDMIFALCLVDFHHVRGPEVQWWKSNYHSHFDHDDVLFRNLPFQALPDGSHLFEETFSNFNLVYDFKNCISLDNLVDIETFKGNPNHLETLFGCLCVRQVKTADLSSEELERNKDITRSIVQKAVVVISRKQPIFTKIKEKLSIITHSYFQQVNFTNFEVLEDLFENLNDSFKLVEDDDKLKRPLLPDETMLLENQKNEKQEEFYVNLNLRHILHQFRSNLLVILKALLLEKKVLIYSNNNLDLLTQFQNNLIALIPDLLNHLELSGCPLSDYTEKYSPLNKPSSLKTNDRQSMLRFFGLPLQIFNTKGSFWNPYLPLQQLDELKATTFMVGCSNLLIANQLTQFKIDVMVNLDTSQVTYPLGKPEELVLSANDKKFITSLLATHQSGESFVGSDDHFRYQFEDYIRSLLATTRMSQYMERFKSPPPGFDVQLNRNLGNLKSFGENFVNAWFQTRNYKIWDALCDEFIFNFHEPCHIAYTFTDIAQSNLSSFLSSFKKVPTAPSLTDRANQYFSHAQKPQKFISEESSESEHKETLTKNDTEKNKGWGWFKK